MSSKSLHNNEQITENLFEKYYLQQNNKSNLSSSANISQNKTSPSLSSSQISVNTDINLESSNYFTKVFHSSVIPYLSITDVINLKKCSKLLNLIVSQKAINICILSNSINNFPSNEYRLSVWGHYMGLKDFTKSILSQYLNNNEKEKENENKDLIFKFLHKSKNKIFIYIK